MPLNIEKDAVTGTDTTGHEWDGITELDNPLPKWWLYVFYATVLVSIVYFILYPSIPWFSGHTTGVLEHTERTRLAQDLATARAERGAMLEMLESASLQEIRDDSQLLTFANAGGRAAFAENCAPCHGSGATGGPGYPNLADDDWLWGGKLADIYKTLKHGVRWEKDGDTRVSDMPRFGDDGLLEENQIADVTEYVLALSGKSNDKASTGRGEKIFKEQCAVCHGDNGRGNTEIGAPNLRDAIWFYGDGKAKVMDQIISPKQGVMPAWQGRLDDATLKMLTTYVHSLGGGQ